MDQINNEYKKVVIMGDMNIDMLKYGTHDATDSYIDGIFSRGFLPHVLKPTRVTHSSATLIDHFLSNDFNTKSTSGIILNDVADHFAIFHSTFSNNAPVKFADVKQVRVFNEININKFKAKLDVIDFSPVLNCNCPDGEAYTKFIDLYKLPFEAAIHFR